VLWYAADKTTLVQSRIVRPGASFATSPGYQPPDVTIAADTWFRLRVDGISPPGGAKFVRLVLSFSTNASQTANSGGIAVDNVSFYRTAREDRTFNLNNYSISGGSTGNTSWYAVNLRSGTIPVGTVGNHDWGHNHFIYVSPEGTVTVRENGTYDVVDPGFLGSGFYCRESGTYVVTANCTLVSGNVPGASIQPHLRAVKNATYSSFTNPLNTGGVVVAQTVGSQWVPLTDWNGGVISGFANAQVSVCQMSFRIELAEGDRLSLEFLRLTDGTSTVEPLSGAILSDVDKSCWWNVRLGLAE